MQQAQSYLQGMPSPFEGVLGAYGQGQTLRQNRDLLQAQQAEQARKIQAQQQLETLDWDDMGAVSRVVAQFPEYTKGAQDYYNQMEAKEQQAMLSDMSKSISALSGDRPDVAVQAMRDKAQAYNDAGMPEKAEEYSDMAEWMTRDPQSARRALLMNYSVMAGKDAGAAFKSYTDANVAENESPVNIAAKQATSFETQAKADELISNGISNAAVTQDPAYFTLRIGMLADQGLITAGYENFLKEKMTRDTDAAAAELRKIARGNPEIAKAFEPELTYTDVGDNVQMTEYDPLTGEVVNKGRYAKGQTPDNKATNAQSDTNNIRTNQTSEGNSIRAAQVSKYNADQQAILKKYQIDSTNTNADKRLEWAMQQEEIKANTAELQTVAGQVLVVYPDGTYRPALDKDGKPLLDKTKDKPLNESQANAQLYGNRMRTSGNIINKLEAEGVTRGSLLSNASEGTANVLPSVLGGNSSKQRQYLQAKRDFINAVLRKESGAAIGESEFASAEKQYFPQVGDTDAVIKQKARNRKLATDTMLSNAGKPATIMQPDYGSIIQPIK